MRILGLTLMVATLLIVSACGTTIRAGQRGVKYISLDKHALKNNVLGEGFYWQWPWNDIVAYDVTLQSRDERVDILTSDNLHVPITVTVNFRPKPTAIYRLHLELGRTYYKDVISPVFSTLVRREFSHHKHNDLAQRSPDIEKAVLRGLRQKLHGKPVQIEQISIKHITYDDLLSAAFSRSLVKKQLIRQKVYELKVAEQDAAIARAHAKGVSDAIRIRAEGQAKAIVLKGRAQALAQKAISATLTARYVQYKAFDGKATRYYFAPIGKNGLPIIVNTEPTKARRSRRR